MASRKETVDQEMVSDAAHHAQWIRTGSHKYLRAKQEGVTR